MDHQAPRQPSLCSRSNLSAHPSLRAPVCRRSPPRPAGAGTSERVDLRTTWLDEIHSVPEDTKKTVSAVQTVDSER